ncbi:hypothetical protein [Plantactinospora sp. GCM10030261]|uniref:hypothetical protein n=1 Tax=Plantactinospora sp. GCM10030261 TaxID=3273420 RepID=UPI003606CC86
MAPNLGLRLVEDLRSWELATIKERIPLQRGEEILAVASEIPPRTYAKAAWDLVTNPRPAADVVVLTTRGLRTAPARTGKDSQPAWVPYPELPATEFDVVPRHQRSHTPVGVGGITSTREIHLVYLVGDGVRSYLPVARSRLDNWRAFIREVAS